MKTPSEIEAEHLDARSRHNEQRERQTLTGESGGNGLHCTCGEPSAIDPDGAGVTCALHGAQSAQMAKLIRKIEDMEFSMLRAVNWIEQGFRGEAKTELMKWIGQRRMQ